MFRYSAFGLAIQSEIELADMPPSNGAPDVVIRLGRVALSGRAASMEEEFAVNSLAGTFHIRAGREILLEPRPDADPEVVRIVLMGRIMAFLLRQRGWLPLHSSGVETSGQ